MVDLNSTPQPWKTLERECLYDTRILSLWKVIRQSLERNTTGTFYTLEMPDWVNVIAETPEEEVVMIRQFRHGTEEVTLEIPGGLVDNGETPAKAAVRELLEETGFQGDAPEQLGFVTANPAIQTNRCYTFFIRNARNVSSKDLQEHEEVKVFTVSRRKIPALIRNGKITHALVIAAFHWWNLRSDIHGNKPAANRR